MAADPRIEAILAAVRGGRLAPDAALAQLKALPPAAAAGAPSANPRLAGRTDIAVIGMAGRFPGANDVHALARNLAAGVDSVGPVPPERWDVAALYAADPELAARGECGRGGFLADFDRFDPLFFQIAPSEAEMMDPQQRLFLQEAWHALEDAGLPNSRLDGARCAVFAGCGGGDYQAALFAQGTRPDPAVMMGLSNAILAARLAYFLNLKGPSIAVDTACSSSLLAVHLACEQLRAGRSDLAVAGGALIMTTAGFFVLASKTGMLAPDGRCKAFDRDANGFVPGETVAAVVLKRLEDAQRDGDRIYGVIAGSGMNQDGRTSGITAPSGPAQSALEREVYAACGVSADSITCVETHGTGTKLGDPIELEALAEAFRATTARSGYCAVGSVKTNLGHALAAAGIAGLIKVLLGLRDGRLYPSLHFRAANPLIDFSRSPFFVNTQTRPWEPAAEAPRRAAVSSFGFSGTNVHLVVEEAPPARRPAAARGFQLAVLSAKTDEALRGRVADLHGWLAGSDSAATLPEIAHTLWAGRSHFRRRAAFVARDRADLIARLESWLRGEPAALEGTEPGRAAERYLAGDDRAPAEWAGPGTIVSLPGYPFARQRYWAPAGERPPSAREPAGLHPLVQENISTLAGPRFRIRLPATAPVIADHRVNGRPVLPGAAMLELTRAAASLSAGREVAALTRVVWTKRLELRPGEPELRCELRLLPREGHADFELASVAGEPHAQGTVEFDSAPGAPRRVNLADALARCPNRAEAGEFYAALRAGGMNYGPAFQAVVALQAGENEAWTQLRLPPVWESTAGAYGWHPALLDAALQTVAGLTAAAGRTLVPFALGRIEWRRALPAAGWARAVRLRAGTQHRYEVTIFDDQGEEVAALSEFELREVTAEAGVALTLAWEREWKRADLAEIGTEFGDGTVIVGGTDAARLAGLLAAEGSVRWVGWSEATAALVNAGRAVWIAPEEAEEIDGPSPSLLAAFSALQAWRAAAPVRPRLVWVFADSDPNAEAAEAFLRSVQTEWPALGAQVISTEVGAAGSAEAIAAEVRATATGVRRVRIAADQTRFFRSWKELPVRANSPPIHSGRVYVISGGAGGIGLLLAEQWVRAGARVALFGRRELSADNAARVAALAGVRYFRADVTSLAAVEAVLVAVRAEWGPIHGVVHAAGVLRDAAWERKTAAEWSEVFAPKGAGARVLDQATRGDPLEHFILCTAAGAHLGSPGQADYAAANAGLEAWSARREALRAQGLRRGRTLAVAWPWWRGGGMAPPAEQVALGRRLLGLEPLEVDEGLAVLAGALAGDASAVLVLKGDPGKLRRAVAGLNGAAAASAAAPAVRAPLETARLEARLRAELVPLVCEVIKLQPSDVDPTADLSDFGFDSISLTRLTNRINEHCGLALMPSVFFEQRTFAEFVAVLATHHAPELTARFGAPANLGGAGAVRARLKRAELPAAVVARKLPPGADEPIAIVGYAGRMPGAEDLEGFWTRLRAGDDLIGEIPSDRWDWRQFDGDPLEQPNRTRSKWGGFMSDVDKFDSLFFGISPREAVLMDPQQRLFLETVWTALEHAGYRAGDLAGTKTGLFVGVGGNEYADVLRASSTRVEAQAATGNAHSILANRISFLLDLRGPSEPVDTACSSSLVAVHRAIEAIRSGSCDQAIAGGVNVLLSPTLFISFGQSGMLSSDGRCKTFDRSADGYVRGEGVGALLLKPLARAQADGDTIHALIRGTAVNHGGKAQSLTAPNASAQADLLVDAYTRAAIDPATVSYVEAHGTGTALGDPVEINGLKRAFAELRRDGAPVVAGSCLLGTVKTNCGHLESAAGMAGLFKVLLALRHGEIPANLHFTALNPYIELEGSPFAIADRLTAWPAQPGRPRRWG